MRNLDRRLRTRCLIPRGRQTAAVPLLLIHRHLTATNPLPHRPRPPRPPTRPLPHRPHPPRPLTRPALPHRPHPPQPPTRPALPRRPHPRQLPIQRLRRLLPNLFNQYRSLLSLPRPTPIPIFSHMSATTVLAMTLSRATSSGRSASASRAPSTRSRTM